MIAAMSSNRVIGVNNDLPWNLPDDFKFFKEKTSGHHIILGRKNWESLPHSFRPLPNRPNIVVTRNPYYEAPGATAVLGTIEAGLELARNAGEEEAFIIGGGEIYRLGLAFAEVIYLTEIDGHFDGDVTFPELPEEWEEIERIHHTADKRHTHAFDFVTYVKKS